MNLVQYALVQCTLLLTTLASNTLNVPSREKHEAAARRKIRYPVSQARRASARGVATLASLVRHTCQ